MKKNLKIAGIKESYFLIGLFLSNNLFYCQKEVDKEKRLKQTLSLLQVLEQNSTEAKKKNLTQLSESLFVTDKKTAQTSSKNASKSEEIILDYLIGNLSQEDFNQSLKYLQDQKVLKSASDLNLSIHSKNFKQEVREKLYSQDISSLESDFFNTSSSVQSKFWQTHCFWGAYCMPMNYYVSQTFWPAAIMCAYISIVFNIPTRLEYKHIC